MWVAGLVTLSLAAIPASAQERKEVEAKPRVVITADPELDDNNTIIRAILYSSDVDLEGIIYASSGVHWRGDGEGTTQYIAGSECARLSHCPATSWRFSVEDHFIDDIVDAYAKVYSNLKVHDADYPSPAQLKERIKWGNVDFEGDFSHDTDGSNLIKALLLDDKPGPVYVTAEGGESTIARAVKSIYEEYAKAAEWAAIRQKVSHKLIIIPSGDQDGTGASYLTPNWPDVRQFHFSGMNFGYNAEDRATQEVRKYLAPDWMVPNITSRGPLGALYRVWGDGKKNPIGDPLDYFGLSGFTVDQLKEKGFTVWAEPEPKGSFIGEGDTGTFLNLVDNGLRPLVNPAWGGWGGWMRAGQRSPFGFMATPHAILPPDTSGIAQGLAPAGSYANRPENAKPQPMPDFSAYRRPPVPPRIAAVASRFFVAAQNDFAARMKWSVTSNYRDANHPPVVRINGPLDIDAPPGGIVKLEGQVSDPDGNKISVRWWQYNDAGTYPGDITFINAESLTTGFKVPGDARPGQTIHVILEATDDGTPPLTRYQRVVVTVR